MIMSYVIMLQKVTWTVAVSYECLLVFHKKLDIQLILQLYGCLSATNISKHNTFSMCDFMLMQHDSHSCKVSQ